MKRRLLLAVAFVCIFAALVYAEPRPATPGALLQHSTDILDYYMLEKKLKEPKPAPEQDDVQDKTGTPAEATPKADGQQILIKKIVTDPSDILTEKEILDITSKYEGKTVSIRELFAVVDEFNKLYAAKKYVTAKAVLPPQKVEDGVVKIRLVEGRVGEIIIENNRLTSDRFITRAMSLKKGDHIKIESLEKDLFYFNSINDVQLKAELKAGRDFGTTDVVLKAEEPGKYQLTLFTDNAGRDTTGLYRAGVIMTNRSLFGFRDPLTIGGTWSEGTLDGSISYSFPIHSSGTRIGVSYEKSSMKVISGPFDKLDIKGDASHIGMNLLQPLLVRQDMKVNAFLEFHYKKSRQKFADITLSRIQVSTADVGFDFLKYDDRGLWYLRNSVAAGQHMMGGDKSFIRYNLYVTRQHVLAKDVVLVLRGSGQLSNVSLLPSSEQFQIGGMATVRGYTEGLLIGDHGYAVSAELSFPLPLPEREILGISPRKAIQGVIFADHGGAFPYKGNNQSIDNDDFLTSVGAGFNLNFSKYLSGKVVWGVPLQNRETGHNSVRLHFYLQSLMI